jgi:tetratricopeptide (TPR) repeat protein
VNELTPATPEQSGLGRSVFVSYATADRKQALSVCEAIERRGTLCWISTRDVEPGDNYQEAIVHAIRNARAMVLVFSEAANNSDEIKKELSLASRYHVPVMALRIEDVEPSDAFAYELSTRQWIDAFEGWDKSIDSLVGRIDRLSGAESATAARPPHRRTSSLPRRPRWIAVAAGLLLLAVAAAAWWLLRPSGAAAHSMTVRLAGFQTLSPDLPATMRDAVGAEVSAAFNADGVIGVSTASAPPPGSAPAYALGGTIHRVGDSIRVITRFTNERSGAILWSDSIDYAADQVSKIPHKIAVDAGIVIRCGLSGASTYRKSLPDSVLKDYMQYCQESWAYGGTKTLLPAQRVVAAIPDFSWGWSAVQTGYMQALAFEEDNKRAEQLRVAGLEAAEKALALDPKNSEALDRKTYLMKDGHDWAGQEKLYKASIAAKPLDCGCEHYGYGLMLTKVGRLGDAIEQHRAATDMLALWPDSQLALAQVLVAAGRAEESKPYFAAAIDLTTDPTLDEWIASIEGTETGNYAAAIAAVSNPQLQFAEETRAALLSGYQALASRDPRARTKAVRLLLALPKDKQNDRVATMLGALGAHREALALASDRPWLLWNRSMRGVLSDPGFPAVANKLGLISYWKSSHTRPDVCSASDAPAFCRSI